MFLFLLENRMENRQCNLGTFEKDKQWNKWWHWVVFFACTNTTFIFCIVEFMHWYCSEWMLTNISICKTAKTTGCTVCVERMLPKPQCETKFGLLLSSSSSSSFISRTIDETCICENVYAKRYYGVVCFVVVVVCFESNMRSVFI